jgi:steroid 5-alpha reductase family enzyme
LEEPLARPQNLPKAFALCAIAYLLALCTAIAVAKVLAGLGPVLAVFLADIAATLVIYVFARSFRNASFYDPYWSLAPIVIALTWALTAPPGNAGVARQVVVAALVLAWGLRLTYNWARQWKGLTHEDWRYRDLRRKTRGVVLASGPDRH